MTENQNKGILQRSKASLLNQMSDNSIFPRLLWSINELTRYLREIFDSDELLQDIWVLGEVSNLARPNSGHLYFTLKDANSALRCVMWRTSAMYLKFLPKEGQAVEAHGKLSIYEVSGQYQLYVDNLRPAGEGALYQEFLRLKNLLEAEGLFDPDRKKPIPRLPKKIGIITSPTGAALHDMLDTIRRRFPCVEVIIAPTAVQGSEAPAGIISALKQMNQSVQPDVILLARGGGSIEDLWAFNDERVARAIADSSIPIVTGIGHETDFTIADFVSDLRAPTPTAAAELATPNRLELLNQVQSLESNLTFSLQKFITQRRERLNQQNWRLDFRSPTIQVQTERQHVDEMLRRIETSVIAKFRINRLRQQALEQSLASLNPVSVLRRGYAIIHRRGDGLISSISQVSDKDELIIRLQDGEFPTIAQIEPNDQAT